MTSRFIRASEPGSVRHALTPRAVAGPALILIGLLGLTTASPAFGLALGSGPLLGLDEPLILTWDAAPGQTLTVHRINAAGVTWSAGPYALPGRYVLEAIPPGSHRLVAELRGADGAVVDTAEFMIVVAEVPAVADPAVQRELAFRLPSLSSQARRGTGRLLVLGPTTWFAIDGAAFDAVLAAGLSRALGHPVEVAHASLDGVPYTDWPNRALALIQLAEADAVLIAPEAEAPWPYPASVGAALYEQLARAAADTGADVLVLSPPLRAGGSRDEAVAALQTAALLRERLSRLAEVINGAGLLEPDQTAWLSGSQRMAAPTSTEAAAGLLATLLTALTRPDDRLPTISAELAPSAQPEDPPDLVLTFTNPLDDVAAVQLDLLAPDNLTPAEGLRVAVPPTGTTRIRRAIDAGAAAAAAAAGGLLAAVTPEHGPTVPLLIDLRQAQPRFGFVGGSYLLIGEPSFPVRVANPTNSPIDGWVRGRPSLGLVPLDVAANTTAVTTLPVLIPSSGRGTVTIGAEAVVGGQRLQAAADLYYRFAVAAQPGVLVADGALDDNLGEWETIAQADAVAVGRDAWQGADDASMRMVLRYDAERLYLAAQVTDDLAGTGDNLELLLAPLYAAPTDAGGTARRAIRRLTVDRNTAAVAGDAVQGVEVALGPNGLIELAIPWTAFGLNAVDGLLLGLDVAVNDVDADEPAVRVSWTGDAWSALDPSRLGLVLLGQPVGAPPAQVMVQPKSVEPTTTALR